MTPLRDFASSIMIRLVAAGLARQGLSASLPETSGAHMPRTQKRAALEAIHGAYGPRAILAISDAAPHLPPEPLVQALSRATDADDLLNRWRRLERFSHARHSVRSEQLGRSSLRLSHAARDNGPAPSVGESLLVLGLVARLVEMAAARFVTIRAGTGVLWRSGGAWNERAGEGFTGSVVLRLEAATEVSARPTPPERVTSLDHLRDRLVADPLRRWSLAGIAADMRMSGRTLQRRLAERSLSLSAMIADTRLQVAASHLCDPNGPGLAETGFLSGYSDQAHFARAFKHAVGTTPGGFRADFQS